MALVGGGGSPNVAGSNPAGTGTSLNYIGNHAYATSGVIEAAAADARANGTTFFDFTTGGNYVKGVFHCYNALAVSDSLTWFISIDDEVIIQYSSEGRIDRNQSPDEHHVLIPSHSRVQLIVISGTTAGAGTATSGAATFVGRVY